jgi:superfamily II DNA or RNA helicase
MKTRRARRPKKLSKTHRPEGMSLEQWQLALRRQFGREQRFKLKHAGGDEVFGDFLVNNPQSGRTYRVAIRGGRPGENHCTCPDFAVNTLGSCKHIEFVLGKLERRPGGKAALRAGYRPPHSEVRLEYGARRRVRFLPGEECPAALRALASRYFDDSGVLRDEAFARFDDLLAESRRFEHEIRVYEDAIGFVAEVRDRDRRRKVIEEAFTKGAASPELDRLVKVKLYDYQKDGALFAARAGRSLIGDEMGLGKTIQAIAAAEIMARHLGVQRVLVICPTSLKHQWEREIARFIGREVRVVSGLRPRRERVFKEDAFFKITNYDTVHADLDLIATWQPDLVILDEAQRIKNWKTRTAQSVKRIESPYAIVLTGTPLENRLEELASIVEFVDRHRLGPTFRFLADHQVLDEHGKVVGYKDLDRIGKTLSPILIRRRKSEVLKQLPPRIDQNIFVPMTPEQRRHHDENKEQVARLVMKWRRQKFLSESDQRRLMIALQNMRMSCDSTYLLDQETDFGTKADELATLLEELYESNGAKVVVFSQWVRMHELIQRRFRPRGWEHVLFHGGVAGPKRKGLIDRFRERERCRAFLSTDAGGVGLNLQFASVVVNMDLPWNPAVLEQRIGRVHRLGQSKSVQVVNFVAQGSIEEGMLGLIKFKRSLFAGALDGGEKEVFLGGSRLNRFMETVEKATGGIPEASVEDAAAAREAATSPTPGDGADHRAEGGPAGRETIGTAAAPAASPADPWAGLLAGGMAILQDLVTAARGAPAGTSPPAQPTPGLSIVHRDEKTGESYLRFPMPKPEVIERFLDTVGSLLDRFRR